MITVDAAIGMTPIPSGVHTPDNVVLTALIAIFVLMGLTAPHLYHIVSNFFIDLVSQRKRSNLFDLHDTAADARTLLLMMIQTSVMEGILLAGWSSANSGSSYALHVAMLSGLAIAFNIFSYLACMTVGYVFTSPQNTMQWRHTLAASQGVLGIGLLIPAAVSVLWPDNCRWVYFAGITLYILVRICYIFKGISFFYSNLLSTFYFILYLCALEIIPVIVVGHAALMLSAV